MVVTREMKDWVGGYVREGMVELVELVYGNYSGRRALEWVCGMSHMWRWYVPVDQEEIG